MWGLVAIAYGRRQTSLVLCAFSPLAQRLILSLGARQNWGVNLKTGGG